MEVVGAGFGDRGDDASGGVAVERRVILTADAELAHGFFGEGVGHSGVATVASSTSGAPDGEVSGGAGFGGVFEVGSAFDSGTAGDGGEALVVVCAVDAGAVLCGGKAAKAEQGFGVSGLGVGVGGWSKKCEGLPALCVGGKKVDLVEGDDACCGGRGFTCADGDGGFRGDVDRGGDGCQVQAGFDGCSGADFDDDGWENKAGEEGVVDGYGVVAGGEVGDEELSLGLGGGATDGAVGVVVDFDGRAGECGSAGVQDEAGDGAVDCSLCVRGEVDAREGGAPQQGRTKNSGEGRTCLYAVSADAAATERHAFSPMK